MYPSIDGHFWVERDGQIIDWDFPWYDIVRSLNGCVKKAAPQYAEADPLVQKVMIRMYQQVTQKVFGLEAEDWSVCAKKMVEEMDRMCMPRSHGQCWQNVVREVVHNGGEIKFGSLGWAKQNGSGVHWEYGGPTYTSLKQFLK